MRPRAALGMTVHIEIVIPSAARDLIFQEEAMKDYFVYILTNNFKNVMYIGMTSDLARRLAEHKSGQIPGFSQKYRTHRLVYFEQTASVESAILREKQIKSWRREKKDALVSSMNSEWQDLSEGWE